MGGNAVNTYRVYFFDAANHIIHARNFEAVADAEAVTRADVLCREVPACIAVEKSGKPLRRLHNGKPGLRRPGYKESRIGFPAGPR